MAIALAVGAVVYNVFVFRNLLFVLGPVGGAIGGLLIGKRLVDRQRSLLLSFPTREALSDYISQNPKRATRDWIWLEYAVARATVHGEHRDQPPSERQADWSYLVRELYPHTRANQRFTIIFAIVSLCLALFFSWQFWEFNAYLIAIAILVGTALALVIWYFATVGFSNDPMTVLAREVEAAGSLPGPERWGRLLAIAQDDPNAISA